MRKSDAYIQQMSVKADLRDMIEKRFIKQVDYGDIGDGGNDVTITFFSPDTDVTFVDDAYIQQMSVKAGLRDMIEKRFIKQVDYGYLGDDGNTVIITFLPIGTEVTFFDDETIITST